jgi:hypothetical protein
LLIFIHIEHTFCICPFLVVYFSATIDGRNLIFGHKLHIGTPYRGKRFLTRQIPTSCLPKSGGIISELSSQFILFPSFLCFCNIWMLFSFFYGFNDIVLWCVFLNFFTAKILLYSHRVQTVETKYYYQ